jgi:carbonic anhydrase
MQAPLNCWLERFSKFVGSLGLSQKSPDEALNVVVEENVKLQVEYLSKMQTIVDAWTKGAPNGQEVRVHGWVYQLNTGLLKDLGISMGANGSISL